MTLSLLLSTSVPVSAHQVWYIWQPTASGEIFGHWGIQHPSTYDGDGIIAASVVDVLTDRSCVWAVYWDGGQSHHQAKSCRYWTDHLFYDQTGNSSALVRVNRERHSDPYNWIHISGY